MYELEIGEFVSVDTPWSGADLIVLNKLSLGGDVGSKRDAVFRVVTVDDTVPWNVVWI